MRTLRELFHHQIQDLHSGETQIIEALPDLIEDARDQELKDALSHHLEETREQQRTLETIAEQLEIDAEGETCKGMRGILAEGDELVEDEAEDDVVDAAIVTACQRVEHYEIAAYGSARTYARMLGQDDIAATLEEILDQEKHADATLTRIAEDHVNRAAAAATV
jgi:ferritin-like metal-binding protein YciE